MFHIPFSSRPRRASLSRGFSLIELAVVVAIIGILAAIAIPTFLGQRAGAQDRQAHSALRNVMTIAKAAAANSDDGNYPSVSDINEAEPQYAIQSGPSADANTISAFLSDEDRTLTIAALSASGTCWAVVTPLDGVTTYGRFDEGDCDASAVDTGDITGTSFGEASEEAAPLTQTDILMALYDALDGDNWDAGLVDNWGAGDPCTWDGITCDNGDVTYINLNNADLNGSLPEELGQLTSLEGLYLGGNPNLSGALPESIGNLVNLVELGFNDTNISGTLPASLGNLVNLVGLYASNAALSGELPEAIMGMGSAVDPGDIDYNLDGNGCLTAETPALESWINATVWPNWDDGC